MTTKEKTNAARAVKSKDAARDMTALTNHIGMVLREAREARGINVDMVADELMIRRFYLDALEQGSFKDLPERVYATGFVRAYATYLGLDVAQLLDQFKREAYGTRNGNYQVELVMPEPIVHSVVPGKAAIVSAVAAVVVIIAGVVFATRNHVATSTTAIPELPAAAQTETVPAPDAAPVAQDAAVASTAPAPETTPEADAVFDVPSPEAVTSPTTVAASPAATATENVSPALPTPTSAASLPNVTPAAAPAKAIVLEALQSSWVEVKDMQGTVLFTSILKAGQLLPLPEEPVSVTTGNAGGLRPVVDGVAQAALGQPNEVKRNVKLDPSQLRQR